MKYQLKKKVMKDDCLRRAYNELAENTFGVNFEKWYQDGYWRETHMPYTLFDEEKAVANISVNQMEIQWQGKLYHYIQLGTVMTESDYRNQGLSRYLIEEVLKDWEEKSDAVFLFANKSVLDFYPKFGFEKQEQYQYSMTVREHSGDARKIEIDSPTDLELLKKYYQKRNPFSKLQAVNGFSLLMFYCGSFLKDYIYYCKENDAVVIAEKEGETLHCLDIFCDAGKDLDSIIGEVAEAEINRVIFKFTPIESGKYLVKLEEDADNTLFVLNRKDNIFAGQRLLFPEICHT